MLLLARGRSSFRPIGTRRDSLSVGASPARVVRISSHRPSYSSTRSTRDRRSARPARNRAGAGLNPSGEFLQWTSLRVSGERAAPKDSTDTGRDYGPCDGLCRSPRRPWWGSSRAPRPPRRRSEVIELKDGHQVVGEVVAEKPNALFVDLGFDIVRVPTRPGRLAPQGGRGGQGRPGRRRRRPRTSTRPGSTRRPT